MELNARIAPNWTSAAGALEGILNYLGSPLPRHAVMGLTGHAWHTCLSVREGVHALPAGPVNLDWDVMLERYSRTGFRWERLHRTLDGDSDAAAARNEATDWAIAHLDAGRPLIGWDLHLHEHAVVYGYDNDRAGFVVDDVLTPEVGPIALWRDWPSAIGSIDLFAPIQSVEMDAVESIAAAIQTALDCFDGRDGPADGQPRGIAALTAWADALDGDAEVDRPGNAYMLAVLQAARMDGADFLADVAAALPELAASLSQAERLLRDEAQALSPLVTLFPFPTGGHGNVANPGLRRAAAMALRRAAGHERAAREHFAEALSLLESDEPASP